MSVAPPYPKIENRYRRREDHALNLEKLRRPEFGLVDRWMVTEKIDGTNIRVSLEEVPGDPRRPDWQVGFYGRSDKAQMPDFIQEYLETTFDLEHMERLWQCRRNCEICGGSGWTDEPMRNTRCSNIEPYPILLYGEAYGARIQKGGGDYRKGGDISFRLFDVLVDEHAWLDWHNTQAIADMLHVQTVPVLSPPEYASPGGAARSVRPVVPDILDFVRNGFKSLVAEEEGIPRLAEGVVARTDPYLFDGQGRRVVWKLKTKDF